MKLENITNALSNGLGKVKFGAIKHGPKALVVFGILSGVAAAVMACHETTKASKIMQEKQRDMDAVEKLSADETMSRKGEYTDEDRKKDILVINAQTAWKFAKLYAPSVAMGAVSIGCILASHGLMAKRNAALGAAYATVSNALKTYRGNIVERFGEDVDKEMRYSIKAKKIKATEADPETGKEKKVKKTVPVSTLDQVSDYARFFDESSDAWEKNAEYNLTFLKAQQSIANRQLQRDGYLFLNDVYRMLGIKPSKAGQEVGWLRDTKTGDGYVDFGIYDIHSEAKRDFVNGYERCILLDFNVDGPILSNVDIEEI